MISLKEWMEAVNYKITEGSAYGWAVYGPNSYSMDSWNGDQDGYSSTITFDTVDSTVYCVETHDYQNKRSYRVINPEYKDAYAAEVDARGVDDVAYDGVPFIDLETEEDFLEKTRSIVAGEDYDTRVSIPLDIPKDDLFQFMMLAHEKDMTLNEFIEEALRSMLERIENGEDFTELARR